jgi:hypothetical protein
MNHNEHAKIYFPPELAAALEREASRLDRPVNWVVKRCVVLGMGKVRDLPDAEERVEWSRSG